MAVIVVPHVITGAWSSFTVTVKLHSREFPEASVARYATVVVPTGKMLPLAGPAVRAMEAAQLSVKVGVG